MQKWQKIIPRARCEEGPGQEGCPGTKITGGKRPSGRTRQVVTGVRGAAHAREKVAGSMGRDMDARWLHAHRLDRAPFSFARPYWSTGTVPAEARAQCA